MAIEVLTDWVVVNGQASNGVLSHTQEVAKYLPVHNYLDGNLAIEVHALNNPTGGYLLLGAQASPCIEDAMFVNVAPLLAFGSSAQSVGPGPGVVMQRTLLSASGGSALVTGPIAAYLRWIAMVSSTVSGVSPAGFWSIAFRIRFYGSPFPNFNPVTRLPAALATLWLRGDQGLTYPSASLASGTVMAWNDLTGLANNLNTLGSTGVTVAPAGLAGMPCISTGSSGGYLFANPAAGTVGPNESMFLVVQQPMAQTTATILDGAGANRQTVSQITNSTTLQLNAGTANRSVTLSSPLTAPTILQIDWNGASTVVYQNGVALAALAGTPGANSFQVGYLGANQSGANPFVGTIAEVLIFNTLLSATNRTRVTRYLGGRYGIVVP